MAVENDPDGLLVTGLANNHQVLCLVDTASSMSFVNEAMAEQLGCLPEGGQRKARLYSPQNAVIAQYYLSRIDSLQLDAQFVVKAILPTLWNHKMSSIVFSRMSKRCCIS